MIKTRTVLLWLVPLILVGSWVCFAIVMAEPGRGLFIFDYSLRESIFSTILIWFASLTLVIIWLSVLAENKLALVVGEGWLFMVILFPLPMPENFCGLLSLHRRCFEPKIHLGRLVYFVTLFGSIGALVSGRSEESHKTEEVYRSRMRKGLKKIGIITTIALMTIYARFNNLFIS